MSELEQLEARYRLLATKLIYASIDADIDPVAYSELNKLGERLARMSAANFSETERSAAIAS